MEPKSSTRQIGPAPCQPDQAPPLPQPDFLQISRALAISRSHVGAGARWPGVLGSPRRGRARRARPRRALCDRRRPRRCRRRARAALLAADHGGGARGAAAGGIVDGGGGAAGGRRGRVRSRARAVARRARAALPGGARNGRVGGGDAQDGRLARGPARRHPSRYYMPLTLQLGLSTSRWASSDLLLTRVRLPCRSSCAFGARRPLAQRHRDQEDADGDCTPPPPIQSLPRATPLHTPTTLRPIVAGPFDPTHQSSPAYTPLAPPAHGGCAPPLTSCASTRRRRSRCPCAAAPRASSRCSSRGSPTRRPPQVLMPLPTARLRHLKVLMHPPTPPLSFPPMVQSPRPSSTMATARGAARWPAAAARSGVPPALELARSLDEQIHLPSAALYMRPDQPTTDPLCPACSASYSTRSATHSRVRACASSWMEQRAADRRRRRLRSARGGRPSARGEALSEGRADGGRTPLRNGANRSLDLHVEQTRSEKIRSARCLCLGPICYPRACAAHAA